MKIIGIDDEEGKRKDINPKKILIEIIVGAIVVIAIILAILYATSKPFRNFMDKYVLMKNVMENAVNSIQIEESQSNAVYAYDKYICVLSQNKLKGYNSAGKQEYELEVEITNPIVDTNNRFLLIAEKEKQKIYLIEGNSIKWEKELEGNISRVSVNKNGYVSVILTGTTYKSIVQTIDASGNKMFKTYLSSNLAVDSDISNDNKYLSFAEISTNGTILQSMIKTVAIQEEQETRTISSLTSPSEGIILNLKYQDGNRLVCMYDNSIHVIQNGTDEVLLDINEQKQKVTFADAELTNYAYRIIEKSSLLNTQSSVEIINTSTKKINTYELDGTVKEVYAYNEKIALNIGSEVHFIGINGWLNKKYISTQEVRNIVIANNFAGIVYRDKIEIVEL